MKKVGEAGVGEYGGLLAIKQTNFWENLITSWFRLMIAMILENSIFFDYSMSSAIENSSAFDRIPIAVSNRKQPSFKYFHFKFTVEYRKKNEQR